ncbi:MAG: alginate O-acetyltransferase complex protein AlgI [Bacteroidia bacterium]|jgi:alginate O-acetyltransferase complex protein AlgI
MVFSSSLFLVYFLPIFIGLYLLTPSKCRNLTALVGSTLFYAWGAPLFVFVVYASLLLDFWLVKQLSKSAKKGLLVGASVLLNIGLLGYFKYANFFVENFNSVLTASGVESLAWTSVVLPIGISFFTFQKLSYTLDVHKGKHKALDSFGDYALYIILFPQLIAGPIVRFNEIADQLTDRSEHETIDDRLLGFFRFCIGLAKKVLVANVVGQVADTAFAMEAETLSFTWAWTGILAYTMQIYFDFSGYSDMAIGLGRMMGFVFPENFNNPYVSSSITEFWRRWHMTLSRWMKDYLYLPLGGNRKGVTRTYFNLWTVFLLSGLWHGASWNFVIWGAYHGLFLVLERLFLSRFYDKIGRIPSMVITFIVAVFGWVVFRAETLDDAMAYYSSMLSIGDGIHMPSVSQEFKVTILFALCVSFLAAIPAIEKWQHKLVTDEKNSVIVTFLKTTFAILIFGFTLSMLSASGFNPFIYFRF